MIYTITVNPAVDYTVNMSSLDIGAINRAESEQYDWGGKGINVSTVLHTLGVESTALGFSAGFTGEFIKKGMREAGIKHDFIDLPQGISRINVKIRAGKETDINGMGPDIPEEYLQLLCNKMQNIKSGDFVIFAGMGAKNIKEDIYARLLERIQAKDVCVIVDSRGNYLLNTLKYRPFLVKPNNLELGEIFGREMLSETDITNHAKKLQDLGARNVLVSLGPEGAVLVAEDGTVYAGDAPKVEVLSTVGAGDSMTAGFIAGYKATKDLQKALYYGLASGSASVSCKRFASKEETEKLLYNTFGIRF